MLPSTQTLTKKALDYDFLIIGYGKDWCGDDGAGPQVAATVADWQLPSVKSLALAQLTPELTADLAKTNYVIFVDACGQRRIRTVQIAPIVIHNQQPRSMAFAAHSYDPLTLLNLTQRLYKRHPQAWLLQIPIESCLPGTELSPKAHQGCAQALRSIGQFLLTYRQPYLHEKSA